MTSPFPADSDRDLLWRACSRFFEDDSTAATPPVEFRHRLLAKTIMKTAPEVRGPMVDALTACLGAGFAGCCRRDASHYAVGMPVVPLKNSNEHNYELGKAVIYGTPEGGNSCFKISSGGDLLAGNNLPGDGPDDKVVRLATPDELRGLLERAEDDSARKLLLLLAAETSRRDEGPFPFELLSLADTALAKLTDADAAEEPTERRRPGRRPSERERPRRPAPEPADDPFSL